MSHIPEATRESQKIFHALMKMFLRRACARMQLSSYPLAQRVDKHIHTSTPFKLLQPTPSPSVVQEDIVMDFITSLPAYQGQSVFVVVVDRFSKTTHVGMLLTYISACKAVEIFTQMFCELHGYPKTPTWILLSSISFDKLCSNYETKDKYCLLTPN